MRSKRVGRFEEETILLKNLCDKSSTSIDIGAADGAYTYLMLKFSKNVISFDPLLDVENNLNFIFRKEKNFKFYRIALSDENGLKDLRVPADNWGRSTIEIENDLNDIESEILSSEVETKSLDFFKFKNIGFVKIDVEGHELKVLKGAKELLNQNLPNLLIEIEERHKLNSISQVTKFLENYGYNGFYLINNCLESINKFDLKQNHNPKKENYINNFIFINSNNTLYNKFVKLID